MRLGEGRLLRVTNTRTCAFQGHKSDRCQGASPRRGTNEDQNHRSFIPASIKPNYEENSAQKARRLKNVQNNSNSISNHTGNRGSTPNSIAWLNSTKIFYIRT